MRIAVVNLQTRVTDAQVKTMVAAIVVSIALTFAPAWNIAELDVAMVDKGGSTADADVVIAMAKTCDDPGALGYHIESSVGKKTGIIGVDTVLDAGGGVFDGGTIGVSLASVLDHEVKEAAIDPSCNGWADMSSTTQVAFEVCDAVENDTIEVDVNGTKVLVSSYVTPAWFDPQAPAGTKFDALGKLGTPFELSPGGYVVTRDASGATKQVFGERYPDWRRGRKLRAERRLQGVAKAA